MNFLAFIAASPIILFMSLIIGFISLFSQFGFLYALPFFILTIVFLMAKIKKQILIAFVVSLILFLSQLSTLLSWLFSVCDLPAEQAAKHWGMDLPSVATAGFPWRSIELPPPPMAAGVPADIWSNIFINNFFWLGISVIIALIIAFLIKSKSNLIKKINLPLFIAAAIVLLFSIARFALWFD